MNDQILNVMSNTLGLQPDKIPDDASIENLTEWDSLKHLELMLDIESEFKLKIPLEDMVNLTTLELIKSYIQENISH